MELKRRHAFKRWAPDIGENRDLIEKGEPGLYFELATGLSAEQLQAIHERMGRPIDEVPPEVTGEQAWGHVKAELRRRYVEAMGEYVRIQGGPHSIGGRRLDSLGDYIDITQEQADLGKVAMTDLFSALLSFNSFTGADELFLQRRSGGSASTGRVVKEKTP